MNLTQVEEQRGGLIQFTVLLIMLFVVTLAFVSYTQAPDFVIPALTLLALTACFYVISRERGLKRAHSRLVREIIEKDGQVTKLDRDLKELSGLYRAISAVNAVVEHEQTLDTVLRAALELIDGNCGSVMLLDERKEYLVISSVRGLPDRVVPGATQALGEGVAGWVAAHDEPLLLRGAIEDDDRFKKLNRREQDVHLAMSIPLRLRGRVFGVLNLGSKDSESRSERSPEPTEFSDYDLRLAMIFAQHASVAIQNALVMKSLEESGILLESM